MPKNLTEQSYLVGAHWSALERYTSMVERHLTPLQGS